MTEQSKKTAKPQKKLVLNKETVRQLADTQLEAVVGGQVHNTSNCTSEGEQTNFTCHYYCTW